MVVEPWLLKMGNQVSSNLKHALQIEPSSKPSSKKSTTHKKQEQPVKETIGILSFEVANVMSKTVHLHKSLTDGEISKLKNEILKSDGVVALVSTDDTFLLELALSEKLEDLNRLASVVSRLGKKCTLPALQGFEHVYSDVVNGVIELRELGFLVKDMEGMVRRMERYVNSTASLYSEMEVLGELELATKKFQLQNQHEESRKVFEQKLVWQKQDVRHLKDVSLWNQTYDKVVELLARTVCTIYARICLVFGDSISRRQMFSRSVSNTNSNTQLSNYSRSLVPKTDQIDGASVKSSGYRNSGLIERAVEKKGGSFRPPGRVQRAETGLFKAEDFNFACGMGPGRLFMECISMSSSVSKFDDDDGDDDYNYGVHDDRSSQVSGSVSVSSSLKREVSNYTGLYNQTQASGQFSRGQRQLKGGLMSKISTGSPKSRLMLQASPSTVGGSALALHYANVILVIEKLLRYPHLVGEEARDDLYQMLPTSLRLSLKTSLKSYIKDLAIYDAPLAHDWKDRVDGMLRWLAPLAHNMIRWQTERNFEQAQVVSRTNVLLLQTLYFADRGKTEAAICELLVGLNYICRYEHQQNALLDCASSFDLDDCMEWQLQY